VQVNCNENEDEYIITMAKRIVTGFHFLSVMKVGKSWNVLITFITHSSLLDRKL